MSYAFLALSPHVVQTGVALFVGPELREWWNICVPQDVSDEDMADYQIGRLEDIIRERGQDVRMMVCAHNESYHPPEHKCLLRRVKRWATVGPHVFVWQDYCRKDIWKGLGYWPWNNRRTVQLMGRVQELYPDKLAGTGLTDAVVEAIAAGHGHAVRNELKVLVG